MLFNLPLDGHILIKLIYRSTLARSCQFKRKMILSGFRRSTSSLGQAYGVGTKRRPKTQKRRPLQNRLEITSKWFECDCRPKQKRETARFAFINKFDEGLRFVHINPTKCTKRRPPQNVLKSLQNGSNVIVDRSRNEKQQDLRLSTNLNKGLRFVHNPTKSTKRRPPQNRLEITSKWLERDLIVL